MATRGRTTRRRRASRALSTPKPEAEERLSSALHLARLDALLGRSTGVGRPSGAPPNDELNELVNRTASYFALSVSDSTRKTYARRWHLFELWCADRSMSSLPATPETLMMYLADSARNGAALGTVRGWCAAINRVTSRRAWRPPGMTRR